MGGRLAHYGMLSSMFPEFGLAVLSANVTINTITVNMELGLLIHSGQLPKQIEQHFVRLIAKKILVKV